MARGQKKFGQRTEISVYLKLYEHVTGEPQKNRKGFRSMTVHGHTLDEVSAAVEKALAEAFGVLQV